MSYGEKQKFYTSLGHYDDVNYDAIEDAKTKYYQNPSRYERDRPYETSSSSGYYTSGRNRGHERVSVVIEHWTGCINQGVADDIQLAISDYFPDVKVTEFMGRIDSFEVFINGKLLYSRIMQGGYPYEEEVLDAIYRAKQGKEIFQVDRYGGSGACTIL